MGGLGMPEIMVILVIALIVFGPRNYIGGGSTNTIAGNVTDGTIAGGNWNTIQSGIYSSIGGGHFNFISASRAALGGGELNSIQADYSTIAGGISNIVQSGSPQASIGGGSGNMITTNFGTIPGGLQAVTRNYGQLAYANGKFANAGDAQYSLYVLRGTNSATGTSVLHLDGPSGSSLEIDLPSNRSCAFTASVVGRIVGGAQCSAVTIRGGANGNGNDIGIIANETAPLTSQIPGTSADVDVIGNKLRVTVTSAAVTGIRWTATVQTTEIEY